MSTEFMKLKARKEALFERVTARWRAVEDERQQAEADLQRLEQGLNPSRRGCLLWRFAMGSASYDEVRQLIDQADAQRTKLEVLTEAVVIAERVYADVQKEQSSWGVEGALNSVSDLKKLREKNPGAFVPERLEYAEKRYRSELEDEDKTLRWYEALLGPEPSETVQSIASRGRRR